VGGRRSEALWKAAKAAAWSDPNSLRVGRPDPGLSASRPFALELPFLVLFPLSGRAPLFPIGVSVASSWKKDVGRPLQNMFRINVGLSPHWVRHDGSVDADSCSDSFRLCFCLYRKAAFFGSPALLLWWLLARGHASTSLELAQIGDLPRRLSITPQDTPASLQEGYQSMINYTRRSGGFWHRVWVVASSLLIRHRVPSSPGLQGGARDSPPSASASSSPPPSPELNRLVRGPQACCAGDFQCSGCASAPGGTEFVAASTIALACIRFLCGRAARLADASVSYASAVPLLTELYKRLISPGLLGDATRSRWGALQVQLRSVPALCTWKPSELANHHLGHLLRLAWRMGVEVSSLSVFRSEYSRRSAEGALEYVMDTPERSWTV
jgi:hypothetical protein